MDVFGNLSCHVQLGYLQKFLYHMLLLPSVIGLIVLMACVAKCRQWRPRYTHASVNIQASTLISLSAFTVYTGVVSRIFRLFKCKQIIDTWYLEEDYSIKCREEEWNTYAIIAGIYALIYVVGLPLFQGIVLFKYRDNLHKDSCKDPKVQRRIEKQYGSIYADYKDETYYFEIIDLIRRLFLSGGLILMGSDSVGQIFLGRCLF
jgi:hypothetical protein